MNIREYLSLRARRMAEECLKELPPPEEWEQERRRRLERYYEMLGVSEYMAMKERPPLNVRITGELQRPGYRVQKLYFESLPRLYLTANLYIPEPCDAPAPAVLYLCGHSQQQKVHYQAHPRKFAQLGFVCLILETIQLGEIEGHHHGTYYRGWFHWYSRGYTPAGVEFWNGVRALDLLQCLPEVDGERIGVTGISGGGAGSWWLAAGDERVRAVAPVCGTATFASHVCERTIDGHCDCMFPINIYQWELADVGSLIAPRPLLIASANRDEIFHIAAICEVYEKLKRLYEHLGAGENIRFVETPGPHSYHPISRKAIFSWFMKHLQGKDVPEDVVGDIDERPEVQETAETVRVYPAGPPPDERVSTIQDDFIRIAQPPTIRTVAELEAHREQVLAFLREKTFRHFPKDPPPLDLRIEYEFETEGASGGRFSFISEDGWRLFGMWYVPKSAGYPAKAMVVPRLPHEGWNAAERWTGGLDSRWARVYVEPRGTGESSWGPELDWHVRRAAMLTGRTIASIQVYDLLRALEAIPQLPGIDGSRLSLAGRGPMAAVVLYAALLHGGLRSVVLCDPPASQNLPSNPDGTGPALEMLLCLRVTDLPQVAGMLWPTELIFLGPRPESYRWAEELYIRLGTPGVIRHLMRWEQMSGDDPIDL